MKKKLIRPRRIPVFPFLIGIVSFVILWAHNVAQIKPSSVTLSFAGTLGFIIVVWLIILFVTRSIAKTSFLASIFFALFFSFGHVYTLIQSRSILGISIGFVKLSIVYLVLFIVAIFLSTKIKTIPANLTFGLGMAFGLLIVYNLANIIIFEVRAQAPLVEKPVAVQNPTVPQGSNHPDVYYIIFDSYGRQDLLQNLLHYDNSQFINALKQRGFYVADCANSNYNGTLLSLASSLNYSYVKTPASHGDAAGSEDPSIINLFMNNKIRSDFAGMGYKFVTARGFTSYTDINNSDVYLNFRKDLKMRDNMEQIEFANLFLKTTLVRVLYELEQINPLKYQLLPFWLYSTGETKSVMGNASYWYYQTNYLFDSLEKLPTENQDYFVYAHFNAPHGPYVFDENGNFRYTHEPADPTNVYNDTITYLNKRILHLVDTLITESATPPIIVLQGDHAPHVIASGYDKHKILDAYYFPDGKSSVLYQTITPVNTFRLILREYFGSTLPLLPDTIHVKLLDDLEEKPSQCEYPK
jgi:hypothetical protein